jgi:hypothetical protein
LKKKRESARISGIVSFKKSMRYFSKFTAAIGPHFSMVAEAAAFHPTRSGVFAMPECLDKAN